MNLTNADLDEIERGLDAIEGNPEVASGSQMHIAAKFLDHGRDFVALARAALKRPPTHRVTIAEDGSWRMAHTIFCEPQICAYNDWALEVSDLYDEGEYELRGMDEDGRCEVHPL